MLHYLLKKGRLVRLFLGVIGYAMIGSLSLAQQDISTLNISNVIDCWDQIKHERYLYDYDKIDIAKGCLEETYQASEREMNQRYEYYLKEMVDFPRTEYSFSAVEAQIVDTERLHLFIKAQAHWRQYREKECELVVSNAQDRALNGPLSKVEWLICMIVHTDARTEALKLYDTPYYPSPVAKG